VVHHAEAEHAAVRVDRENGDTVLTVEDDGRGFRFGDAMRLGGLGLLDMQERASVVGGTVDIDSSPGRGTRIRARVPMETAGNGNF
jgi:signal transduction histidine kinase